MPGAVKIAQRLDAIRTGAKWEQDFVFTLSDRVTPQAAWVGCTAEVILSPRSAPLRLSGTVRLDTDHVSVVEGEARVRVRVPMGVTPDYLISDYVVEINRIEADNERYPAAFGDIRAVQGQSQIADGDDPEGDVGGLGATVGTVIITALGSTVATGTGPAGLGLQAWKTISANYAARPGDRLICDSSTGAFAVTLPAGGGDVWIEDLDGSFGVNAVTVIGNGRTINGAASDTADDGGFRLNFTSGDEAWSYTFEYLYGSV